MLSIYIIAVSYLTNVLFAVDIFEKITSVKPGFPNLFYNEDHQFFGGRPRDHLIFSSELTEQHDTIISEKTIVFDD